MSIDHKILVAVLAGSATAAPALADSLYAAFDVGQSIAREACSGIPAWVTGCSTKATAFRLAGGYQVFEFVGFELSYADYGKASAGSTPYGTSVDWQASGLQFSALANLPVGSTFSLLGKFGASWTMLKLSGNADVTASSAQPSYGLGAQYQFTQRFFVRALYEDLGLIGNVRTGTTKLTLFSAGIGCKF